MPWVTRNIIEVQLHLLLINHTLLFGLSGCIERDPLIGLLVSIETFQKQRPRGCSSHKVRHADAHTERTFCTNCWTWELQIIAAAGTHMAESVQRPPVCHRSRTRTQNRPARPRSSRTDPDQVLTCGECVLSSPPSHETGEEAAGQSREKEEGLLEIFST